MKKLMLGNEAIARGAYEAGATVASSYPGTPSTEITENIAKYDEIYSEWSPNEKVSLEVVVGASIAGARSISAMKHVGLNVAADPLFTASYTGVNGGLVIAVADDHGMHSSQNEQDSRHYARSAKLPMLQPSDSQECKDFVKIGYEISENFDTPIIVGSSTRISHSLSIVELEDRVECGVKEYKKDFEKYVMMPAMGRKRHVVVEERINALKEFAAKTDLNRIEWGSKDIGVVTSGIAYQYAREAFGDVSYLKLGLVYPLSEDLIKDFAEQVDTLYVVEEGDPFFENQIKAMGIDVIGKDRLPMTGELNAQVIREKLLDEKIEIETLIPDKAPVRPPVMCPGCPHRGAFHVMKKLELVVTGDIGCYTLGALPPTESMDTCVCMGGGVSLAHGMEKAQGKEFAKKTIGVVGDSTFMHSGVTGLIDIVYNKGISTIMILDNSITGMTGHQDNPTTGYTIKGEPTRQVDLIKLCKSLGIEKVEVADPFDLVEFEKVVKEAVEAEEPAVVISQRPCALLPTANYTGHVSIDTDVCDYCQQCTTIGCPAIVDKDDHIEINEALCDGCMLCAEKCHFDVIIKVGDIDG
ncbi:MAG: indolepyruvate ferredoxin oxidoreductase subunit alpha [Halanaerobiaceae bacterium]